MRSTDCKIPCRFVDSLVILIFSLGISFGEGFDTSKMLYEVSKIYWEKNLRILNILEDSSNSPGTPRDSKGFLRILGILWDSVGFLGESRGFSWFLENVYEVSEVSNPSSFGTRKLDLQ